VTGAVLVASAAAAAAVLLLALPRPAVLRLHEVLAAQPSAVPVPSVLLDRAGGLRRWGPRLVVPTVLVGAVVAVGVVTALLVLSGGLVGRRWWRSRTRARAVEAERRAVVEACSVLAAELRAGRTAAEALGAAAGVAVGPSQVVLQSGAASAALGGDVAGALAAVPSGSAVGGVLRSLAACWSVCSATGSGLAAAVDRLEEGLRADEVLRQALAAELAGPRATAGLLAVLPVVGLVLAGALGADPLHVLLHTPLGLVCLVAGIGLDALGVLWTQRLVRRAGG
jgi:tight adherence protein B